MATITVDGTQFETELVIFDKDGTLLDFKDTWIDIIKELIGAIGKHVSMNDTLHKRIETALGIFPEERRIDGYGPLAMGTFQECDALLTHCIYREGLRWDKAQTIVQKAEKEIFSGAVREQSVRAAKGAIDLLKNLKAKGINTAVATNDSADDATQDMRRIGALPYIDLIVGADSVSKPKPAPDMVLEICKKLAKSPSNAVLIGDTLMDALLGKNAGVMLTIGVTGVLTSDILIEHTDVVIDSLTEIS